MRFFVRVICNAEIIRWHKNNSKRCLEGNGCFKQTIGATSKHYLYKHIAENGKYIYLYEMYRA